MLRNFCLACKAMTVSFIMELLSSDRELGAHKLRVFVSSWRWLFKDWVLRSRRAGLKMGTQVDVSLCCSVCPTRLLQSRVVNYLLEESFILIPYHAPIAVASVQGWYTPHYQREHNFLPSFHMGFLWLRTGLSNRKVCVCWVWHRPFSLATGELSKWGSSWH